jgi:hypothetical protein
VPLEFSEILILSSVNMEQTLPDYHIPSDELFIVSKYDSGQSFATISVAREERRNAFCSVEEM